MTEPLPLNSDGTPLRATPQSNANEEEVRLRLQQLWNCEVHRFAYLSPIDFYAVKDNRIVGMLELKSRDHASTAFPTVFLSVRKWLALNLANVGMGVPALFVARFTDDALLYIRAPEVDARKLTLKGPRNPQKATDTEPLIEVPIDKMTRL